MIEDLFSLFSVIIIIVVVMALAYLFTRYVVGRLPQSGLIGTAGTKPRKKRITVLEQVVIGKEQRLVLVKMDDTAFFLAVSSTGVSTLKEIGSEQLKQWQHEDEALLSELPPDFQTSLRNAISNYKNKGGKA